ncbi:hypothetical protein [Cellulomonas shaoxiangyii]|uniref:hypothetical protein n=1 Tax=Cellulomonas shaoxiangyii TaxID=2566013 RepID=UPI00140A61D5|nr:hypothetical protein [Cellulomonas shaoxiangyii]
MATSRIQALVDAARADVAAARTALAVLDDVWWRGRAADAAAHRRAELDQAARYALAALDQLDARVVAAREAAVCRDLTAAHPGGAP